MLTISDLNMLARLQNKFFDWFDENCQQTYMFHGWEWEVSGTDKTFKTLREVHKYYIKNIANKEFKTKLNPK